MRTQTGGVAISDPKKTPRTVPEELSEEDIENVVGGGTLTVGAPSVQFKPNLIGRQNPLDGKVKKPKDEQDYPIEHGI